MNVKDFKLNQCFYGEHLLSKFPKQKVGILESEKSALIASLFHPEYIWLGCGGADGLTDKKVPVLKGREVTLFPDLTKAELWEECATKIKNC